MPDKKEKNDPSDTKPDSGPFFVRFKRKEGFGMGYKLGKNEPVAADDDTKKEEVGFGCGRIKEFFSNQIVLWMLIAGLILNVINWGLLFFLIKPIDPDIILHYNVYFGVDMSGNYRQAFSMPLVGIIIYMINAAMAFFFYCKKERIASYVLLLAAFMAELCLIVASASIIIINY